MVPNHSGGTTVGNSFAVPSAIDVRVRCTPGAVFKNAPRLLGCVGETATNAVKPSPNDGGSNPTWKPPTALPVPPPLAPTIPTPPRKRAHPPSIGLTIFDPACHSCQLLSIRNKILYPDWNRSALLAIAAATIHNGRDAEQVRDRILAYNKTQGIVSMPDYGYHETVTRFWVERIRESVEWDAARAAFAAFAHRGRLFDSYYTIDIAVSREAGANYHPLDIT